MFEDTIDEIDFTAEQLPDCPYGFWYVTKCNVAGVVGIRAESVKVLKEILPMAVDEIQLLQTQETDK